jgi:large subunit ribosomal protein L7/L12
MGFFKRLLGRDDRDAMDHWTEQVPTAAEPQAWHGASGSPEQGGSAPSAMPLAGGSGVFLVDPGRNKIAVIKAVREATGLGLKEAKDLVEAAPVQVASGLDAGAADEFRYRLRKAGAQVD